MIKTADEKKNMVESVTDAIKRLVSEDLVPKKEMALAAGATLGTGILASILLARHKNKKRENTVKDNIKLYQAIESPYVGEESVIDRNIFKEASMAADLPIYAASATIPAYLAVSTMKNQKEEENLDKGRREVGTLRDLINDAYRQDMLEAYGIDDPAMLDELVVELRQRANPELFKESMDKEAAMPLTPISVPAALVGSSALGLGAFLLMKNRADAANPNRLQEKRYLDKLDRLYRERLVSPTIRELPFTDEELLALELYKQEKGKKKKVAPKTDETPLPIEVEEKPLPVEDVVPEGAEVVDMDDEDIQSILKEL
jgi:hypothetical protein